MVKSIGTEGPSSPTDSRWPEESVVLEALSGMIQPACIEAVLRATGRKAFMPFFSSAGSTAPAGCSFDESSGLSCSVMLPASLNWPPSY